MHGVGIGGGVHRDYGNAELLAGPQYAKRNLAAVGYEDLVEHLLDDDEWFAELDRLAVFDEDLRHGPGARRGDLVHGLHRFDDQQRLARGDAAADLDEGFGAGLGRPIGGADHGRGHHARMVGEVRDRSG